MITNLLPRFLWIVFWLKRTAKSHLTHREVTRLPRSTIRRVDFAVDELTMDGCWACRGSVEVYGKSRTKVVCLPHRRSPGEGSSILCSGGESRGSQKRCAKSGNVDNSIPRYCPYCRTLSIGSGEFGRKVLVRVKVKAKFHYDILVTDRSEADRRPASSC